MEISKQQQITRNLNSNLLRLALARYQVEELIVTGQNEKITCQQLDEIIRLQHERKRLLLL